MSFLMKNESFNCENCNKQVSKHPEGSARNHCPYCLHSKHLDDKYPGDRASMCGGIMKPIDIEYKKNKGWMIVQQCQKCSSKNLNKLAPDDDIEAFSKIKSSKEIV